MTKRIRVSVAALVVGLVLAISCSVWAGAQIRTETKTVYYRADLKIVVDGRQTTLDVKPFIIDPGWIMVPAEFISKELGASVAWDDASSTFTIGTTQQGTSAFLLGLSDQMFQLVQDCGVSITSFWYLVNPGMNNRKQFNVEVYGAPSLPSVYYFKRLVAIGSYLGLRAYDLGLKEIDVVVVSASDGVRGGMAAFTISDIRAYKEGRLTQPDFLTQGGYWDWDR